MKQEYKEEDYRVIFGVEKATFYKMVELVTNEYNTIHKKGGERMVLLHKNVLK